jgi:hypothetical protein
MPKAFDRTQLHGLFIKGVPPTEGPLRPRRAYGLAAVVGASPKPTSGAPEKPGAR